MYMCVCVFFGGVGGVAYLRVLYCSVLRCNVGKAGRCTWVGIKGIYCISHFLNEVKRKVCVCIPYNLIYLI